jgi:hypothetical protein
MTRAPRCDDLITFCGRLLPCVIHDMKKARHLRQQIRADSELRVGLPTPLQLSTRPSGPSAKTARGTTSEGDGST